MEVDDIFTRQVWRVEFKQEFSTREVLSQNFRAGRVQIETDGKKFYVRGAKLEMRKCWKYVQGGNHHLHEEEDSGRLRERAGMIKLWVFLHKEYGEPILKGKYLINLSQVDQLLMTSSRPLSHKGASVTRLH